LCSAILREKCPIVDDCRTHSDNWKD
jgi:hypothetical protein